MTTTDARRATDLPDQLLIGGRRRAGSAGTFTGRKPHQGAHIAPTHLHEPGNGFHGGFHAPTEHRTNRTQQRHTHPGGTPARAAPSVESWTDQRLLRLDGPDFAPVMPVCAAARPTSVRCASG